MAEHKRKAWKGKLSSLFIHVFGFLYKTLGEIIHEKIIIK